MILLDHNAGAPPSARARDALLAALASGGANPSSVHGPGRTARAILEGAREAIASAIGAGPESIVLTSGATESVHLAIRGAQGAGAIVATDVEHPAVEAALVASGRPVVRVPARTLDAELDGALSGAILLTLPLGGHETGDLWPLAAIAARARAKGVRVHADAAQALGRIPVDVGALGVDLLSLSAHKAGGLPGAGALYVRPGTDLGSPLFGGGGQERGRRGGTEAWALHAAFGAAASELAPSAVAARRDRMAVLLEAFETRTLAAIPGSVVNGAGGSRLPNTVSLSFEGVDGHELVIALDLRGFAVSSGSACASGLREPSPVVRALHPEEPWRAASALRVSIGPETTEAVLADFSHALADSVAGLRAGSRVRARS